MNDFVRQREELLSTEKGRITKKSCILRVALGFPNTYEVGMSNLGFQTIYRLINRMDQVACERFFLFEYPAYRGARTLESDRPIRDFELIAFSVPFELDYPNVLQLLKLSKIPLLSSQRKRTTPLIIGGGVAPTLNPEILAPFFDCLFIGEAEGLVEEFIQQYLQLLRQRTPKEELLQKLSQIDGVYVPRFYQVSYHDDGTVKKIKVKGGVPSVIQKRSVNLKGVETFSPIISPYAHFKNSFLIEVGRGCARRCRFCAAGYIYQPCRFYARKIVLSQAERYAPNKGHIGLIGSLISDHPELEKICQALHQSGFEIGTSSLRVDMISFGLLKILVDSGMRTLTLAPEVGTEKMWRVINKKIDQEAVLNSARLALEAFLPNLKLYFIIGLPFEQEEDLHAIVDLILQVHHIFIKGHKALKKGDRRIRRLTISVNPFVPKPHTPFQWCAMNQQEELKRKLRIIYDEVKDLSGIHFERKSIRQAILQGMFSLGNRKVGEGLFYRIGEGLNLRQAWKKAKVNPDAIVFKPKRFDSSFPWDIIDPGLSKGLLIEEFEKARKIATEPDK